MYSIPNCIVLLKDVTNLDKIIPCHGDVIETGGKGIFDKIMQWHLEAAKKGH